MTYCVAIKLNAGLDQVSTFRKMIFYEKPDDRILPLDTLAARLSGRLSDQAAATGHHPGFADVAIAAIAMQSNQLLLTRKLKHFQPLGVACADPVKPPPSQWII